MDATDTPTVTVLRAPRVDCPNSDCSSQNVLLVTCTAEQRTRAGGQGDQHGVEPDVRRDGARIPADVIAEMVTEPTAMCSAAAISPHHEQRCGGAGGEVLAEHVAETGRLDGGGQRAAHAGQDEDLSALLEAGGDRTLNPLRPRGCSGRRSSCRPDRSAVR